MQPGALLGGKYILTCRIGIGAMGAVWAAVNKDTGREVAVKLILQSTNELRQRLRREARAVGKLEHRNLIEIYDIGETADGEPFLVMPLLHGETLSDLLAREGRLEQEVAARFARDVARALAVAHGAGVIHRDLKPANIFLHRELDSEGPVIKVLDFGVSKSAEAADGFITMAGGMVGSPAYMSPEQAKAEPSIDPSADLWSLGVILFEMLAGERPFTGTPHQLILEIVHGKIPTLESVVSGVDPALSELVSRCLVRDRDRRLRSAADLANALQRFVGRSQAFLALGQMGADLTGGRSSTPAVKVPPPDDDDDESDALTVQLNDRIASLMRQELPAAQRPDVPSRPADRGDEATVLDGFLGRPLGPPRVEVSPAVAAFSPRYASSGAQSFTPTAALLDLAQSNAQRAPPAIHTDPRSSADRDDDDDDPPFLQGGTIRMQDPLADHPPPSSSLLGKGIDIKLPGGVAHRSSPTPAEPASSRGSTTAPVLTTLAAEASPRVPRRIAVAVVLGVFLGVLGLAVLLLSLAFSSGGTAPQQAAPIEAPQVEAGLGD